MVPYIDVGGTFNYLASIPNYSAADGWGATLYLNPRAGGMNRSVEATASGEDHLFEATGGTTGAWTAGLYAWELWVSKDTERYRIDGGQVELRATLLSAAAGLDTRTLAERARDEARAALAAWTPTTRRYTIAGRQMEFNSSADIIAVIDHWEGVVKREKQAAALAAGLKSRRKLQVRLGR